MKYFELLGLPGSGKTALLRFFRARASARQEGKSVISEDWTMVLRRFGHRHPSFLRGLTGREPGVPRAELLKNLTYDYWQMGVLAEYPELFSRIFLCLETVNPGARQREILLNYWRSRASLFSDVVKSTSASSCFVDEGLSQSVFSTVTRMVAPSNQKLELVASVLRSLPPERTVVMLRTPPKLIELRAQSGRAHLPVNVSAKTEELELIFQYQKTLGRDTVELDGSLSLEELCTDLEALVAKRVKG